MQYGGLGFGGAESMFAGQEGLDPARGGQLEEQQSGSALTQQEGEENGEDP